MERLDPQGEENGDPMTSFHQINRYDKNCGTKAFIMTLLRRSLFNMRTSFFH